MVKKVYKRYSEAFRIQVVREYEQGGYSLNALHKRYGMSILTLTRWIRKYSTQGLRIYPKNQLARVKRNERRFQ